VYSISHEPELDIEVHLNDTGIAHYTTACGRWLAGRSSTFLHTAVDAV